ncbi:MAG TPA: hypothetical protein VLZ89_02300 [Anaerolineales bacterium]|nr:hypothetical protein [Anaerolineales bacterium]
MQIKWIAYISLIVIGLALFQNVRADRTAEGATATATAAPAAPSAIRATPTFQASAPPLSLTLTLAFTCCALAAVLGILVLGIVVSMGNRRSEQKKK